MKEVIERKIVNICIPGGTASADVGLNIPFKANEMIVREFAYNTSENATSRCLQLATNMVQDQVLFVFPATTNSSHLEHTFILDNFTQNRVWNFSIQVAPSAGTGTGNETTVAGGNLGSLFFMLEFIRYSDAKK